MHFEMYCEYKMVYFDLVSTDLCSEGSYRLKVSIGSGNDLGLNGRKAIAWTSN